MSQQVVISAPRGSRWANYQMSSDSDGTVTITPDVVGVYSVSLRDGGPSHTFTAGADVSDQARVGVPFTVKIPTLPIRKGQPGAVETLAHDLVESVVLQVKVQAGAVIAAQVIATDAGARASVFAASDPNVIAAANNLVGAPIATVKAAVAVGSPLMLAWAAALQNNAPNIPNEDPAAGALELQGWKLT